MLHCRAHGDYRSASKNFRRDHPVDENERPVSRRHKTSVGETPSKRLKMSTEGSQEITDEEYKETMDELISRV